jgi:Tfp pilus assembly protein PilO
MMMPRLPDLREIRPTALIVLLAALAVNLAALFLVNLPQAARLARADEEIRGMLDQLEGRREQVASLASARDRIEEQSHTVEVFLQEILSAKSERMVAVQRELREIGARNGISQDSIRYGHQAVAGAKEMVRFTAGFPLVGSYSSLRAFLRDIETSRNFLVIDSIELTRAKEGGVILSMTISVSTIFRDPDYGLVQGGR